MSLLCGRRLWSCALLLTVCLTETKACPTGWSKSTSGSCYMCYTDHSQVIGSIIVASNHCKREGGQLASLRTPEDLTLVTTLLSNVIGTGEKYAYVGLNDINSESQFEWLDNTAHQTSAVPWKSGQPDDSSWYGDAAVYGVGQDCVVLTYNSELWDTACCEAWTYRSVHSIICEYYPTAGTVDDSVFRAKCNLPLETTQTTETTAALTTVTTETTDELTTSITEATVTTTGPITTETTDTTLTTMTTETTDTTLTTITTETTDAFTTVITETTVTTTGPITTETTDTTLTTMTTETTDTTLTTIITETTDTTSGPIIPVIRRASLPSLCWQRGCQKGSKADLDMYRVLKNETSLYKRRFISAYDGRVSSAVIGCFASTLIFIFALFFVITDSKKMWDSFVHNSHIERHRK